MMRDAGLIVASLLLSLSPLAEAARPSPMRYAPTSEAVIEVLRRPAADRHRIIAQQPDGIYRKLIDISETETVPMDIRWKALTAAAVHQREKSVEDLLKASESKDWFMRNASLIALQEYAPVKAREVARRLVMDPALVVRSAAVRTLAKDSSLEATEVLWKELNEGYNRRGSQSLWIRGEIAEVLATRVGADELNRIAQLLNDDDGRVRLASVRGLERLTGKKLGEGAPGDQVAQLWKNYFAKSK